GMAAGHSKPAHRTKSGSIGATFATLSTLGRRSRFRLVKTNPLILLWLHRSLLCIGMAAGHSKPAHRTKSGSSGATSKMTTNPGRRSRFRLVKTL
ncbi:MAG: hypothetical protein ACKO0V_02815, partial [bacterium]